jgi:hypothetical protein
MEIGRSAQATFLAIRREISPGTAAEWQQNGYGGIQRVYTCHKNNLLF